MRLTGLCVNQVSCLKITVNMNTEIRFKPHNDNVDCLLLAGNNIGTAYGRHKERLKFPHAFYPLLQR